MCVRERECVRVCVCVCDRDRECVWHVRERVMKGCRVGYLSVMMSRCACVCVCVCVYV